MSHAYRPIDLQAKCIQYCSARHSGGRGSPKMAATFTVTKLVRLKVLTKLACVSLILLVFSFAVFGRYFYGISFHSLQLLSDLLTSDGFHSPTVNKSCGVSTVIIMT